MNEIPRTQGEILFEQYLASQCLAFEFEKEHAGKSKRPDYTIAWHGQTIVFDPATPASSNGPFWAGAR